MTSCLIKSWHCKCLSALMMAATIRVSTHLAHEYDINRPSDNFVPYFLQTVMWALKRPKKCDEAFRDTTSAASSHKKAVILTNLTEPQPGRSYQILWWYWSGTREFSLCKMLSKSTLGVTCAIIRGQNKILNSPRSFINIPCLFIFFPAVHSQFDQLGGNNKRTDKQSCKLFKQETIFWLS